MTLLMGETFQGLPRNGGCAPHVLSPFYIVGVKTGYFRVIPRAGSVFPYIMTPIVARVSKEGVRPNRPLEKDR